MLNIFIKTFFFISFISSPIYSFEIKWVVDGLNEPESVVFDKKNSAIYISNINGDPLKLDKNGYISKISVDGQILEKKWIKGLDAPKGMTIFNDHLFVADINKIWKINTLNKNKQFSRWVNDHDILVFLHKNKVRAISNICPDIVEASLEGESRSKCLYKSFKFFSPFVIIKPSLFCAPFNNPNKKIKNNKFLRIIK